MSLNAKNSLRKKCRDISSDIPEHVVFYSLGTVWMGLSGAFWLIGLVLRDHLDEKFKQVWWFYAILAGLCIAMGIAMLVATYFRRTILRWVDKIPVSWIDSMGCRNRTN